MSRNLLLLPVLLMTALTLPALEGEIVYVEGAVDLKTGRGDLEWADIGMPVETGDSIITGYDGYAELEMEDGSTVKVSEDSIFALSSLETDGVTQNSFQCVLGSVQYKFTQTIKEHEPQIGTPSTICGIRGTEFTVVSGLDGSALYVVDDGLIAVSSQGEEVELGALQGVRVEPGEAPGEIFPVLRGQIDFSQVRKDAEQRFLESPAASMRIMVSQLEAYIAEMKKQNDLRLQQKEYLTELREKMEEMGAEEKQKFYKETVFEEEVKITYMALNIRYYSLSALSLRRFLVGTMYVNLRTRYINDPSHAVYLEFRQEYERFLQIFETEIPAYLVIADI